MNWKRRALISFVLMAVPLTVALLGVYSAVQQDLRQTANDQPMQRGFAAQILLNAGSPPRTIATNSGIELANSLSSFVAIYDAQHNLLASDAVLNGSPLSIPTGVLDNVQNAGSDAVTWQPQDGVRIALVGLPWKSGVVMAGLSLKLTDNTSTRWAGKLPWAGLFPFWA